MNNTKNKKESHRKLLLDRRQKYAISENIEIAILDNLTRFLETSQSIGGFVGLYWPLNGEIDTLKIASQLSNIALPKLVDDSMVFVKYTKGEALEESGIGGLMQPSTGAEVLPGIVIVPGLAFSLDGYRLGFGKGYYDRYFAKSKNADIISVGICPHEDLQEHLPHEEHDHKFDYIITDKITLKI